MDDMDDVEAMKEALKKNKHNSYVHDYNDATPLYIASKYNRTDVVDFLLAHGKQVNATSIKYDFTVLHTAAMNGYIDNYYGITPIVYAVIESNFEIIKLLTNCSDLTRVTENGNTILTHPVQKAKSS